MRRDRQCGYTFFELIIVVLILVILATVVAVNFPAIVSSVDIELATSQVHASVVAARRAALSGNPSSRSVNISAVVPAAHPGVVIVEQAANGLVTNCQQPCATNQKSLCVSGNQFCYLPAKQFEFTRYTGELNGSYAIFLLSDRRKLAVLVQQSGEVTIAEFINDSWRTKADLQGLK